MSPAEAANLQEICQIYERLAESPDPLIRERVRCLDELHADALLLEGDRVLRIVGVRLAQEGLGALFEEIYAAALEGCEVAPGDGRRFLQAELAEV